MNTVDKPLERLIGDRIRLKAESRMGGYQRISMVLGRTVDYHHTVSNVTELPKEATNGSYNYKKLGLMLSVLSALETLEVPEYRVRIVNMLLRGQSTSRRGKVNRNGTEYFGTFSMMEY